MAILKEFDANLSAYFPPPPDGYASPEEATMEGGDEDQHDRKLCTLDDFYLKRAAYVSVAMDDMVPDATPIVIDGFPNVTFLKVDAGRCFAGAGWGKIDICVADRAQSLKDSVNRKAVKCWALVDPNISPA